MAEKRWRALLLDLKQDLKILDNAAEESRTAVELDQSRVGRLSRMDALQGQAMNKAIALRRRQKILAIDAAIERLCEGEFGYCVKCGDEIALKRLELDPTASMCLGCSQ
jgi:DnaK suppressor protein